MQTESAIKLGKEKLMRSGISQAPFVMRGKLIKPTVPGLGAAGSGLTFSRNREALSRYALKTRLLGEHFVPDTTLNLFGQKLSIPILPAPMSGIKTSLKDGITEREFLRAVLLGSKYAGSLGLSGESYATTAESP